MYDMSRRLKKAESKLNLDNQKIIVTIVLCSDGPLPPEQTNDNITTRYVRYDDICKEKAEQ